ncbi:MAG: YnbE family lipoprotein [Desulfotignum sp.]|nr:YnbE family lipoprotein [Desulfotignum sp.]MCF8114327.1 YnbE family lipoprotein [Desulfotignum sp.]MCF8125418.1 YnbE family lipoprotein [Desulfotignum sp.]
MTLKPCIIPLVLALMMIGSCRTSHEVEVKPVEIKPIHITIDVNVKVQKALDDFFKDIDDQEEKIMEKLEKQDEN